MTVTLKDIADLAGLSTSTVSQILNRRSNDFSSVSTRRLVFHLARELGYKQKFGHKLLRGDKTHTVGILFGMHRLTLEEHIQAMTMRLLSKLEAKNYSTYLVTLSNEADKNLRTLIDLCHRGVDAFILLGSPVGELELAAEAKRRQKGIIGYYSNLERNIIPGITAATRQIIEFFLAQGHFNFKLFLNVFSGERVNALRELFPELSEAELRRRHYVPMDFDQEHFNIDLYAQRGYEKTKEVVQADPSVRAFFYLSDYYAIGGIKYLCEIGRVIGRDVLVAGFNNIHAIRTHYLPISTVEHDVEGQAKAFFSYLETDPTQPFHITVPCKTIIRTI